MAYTLMRLNFMHQDPTDPQQMSDRYRCGIELAEYVDRHGFDAVTLEEHHSNALGWSPTPLLNAGMILARTESITVTISALLLPLHDPIRVAEDVAVLDLVGKGRAVHAGRIRWCSSAARRRPRPSGASTSCSRP